MTEKPLVDVTSNHPNRYELTPDNYFNFLFYQSRRDKYKKGLKNVVGETKFDAKDYDRVTKSPSWISDNPLGIQAINQYKCCLIEMHQSGIDKNNGWAVSLRKEQLNSRVVACLFRDVLNRKPRLNKVMYKEKISKIAPYTSAEELPRMEDFLFNENKILNSHLVTAFRNRYTLLQTTYAIIRGESLFLSELSDLMDIKFTCSNTGQKIHIGIMQIFFGKTNRTRTIYGRVMRHRNAFICPMGALGMYLLARFEYTK